MNYEKIEKQLIKHEGFRSKPYFCTAGKISIGVGRNLEGKGITKEEALFLLKNDIMKCTLDLESFLFPELFQTWDEELQFALIDMRFQLGMNGFRGFKRMIAALRGNDRELAAAEAENSLWFNQVPSRARTIIQMIRGEI